MKAILNLRILALLSVASTDVPGLDEQSQVQPARSPSRAVTPSSALPAASSEKPNADQVEEKAYRYYGNTPEEMIPFRGVEPHFRYWTTRLPFRGPGRDYPDPTNLASLKVGLLSPAPRGPEGARGERTRRGVWLAFEEANAARKPRELPFELISREDSPQWGSAANIAVEFKDQDILGYLGTIDGDATHVALRVSLKIETFMINTSDPDPTLTETQIPWLLRIFPDDRQQGWRLAHLIIKERGCHRVAILRESSRPGRVGVMHFIHYIRRLGSPAVAHLLYQAGDQNLDEQIKVIKAANPDAVLFYGQPGDIGHAVALLRQTGVQAQFFGFDRLMETSFTQRAGPFAEGVTITYFFNPERNDKSWVEFAGRFQKRWGEAPEIYAAYGYDGARLMIEAIEQAGPNRFRIRDYLANLDEWDGVTGHMIFDGRWDNIAPISVVEYKQGRWHFQAFPAPRSLGQSAEQKTPTANQPAKSE